MERKIKTAGTVLCEIFAAAVIIVFIGTEEYDRLALALITPALILLPWAAEKIFHLKISLPLYLFCLFYALGPMLGHCLKFYYTVPGWDKLLHISGGVVFAIVGAYLLPACPKPR